MKADTDGRVEIQIFPNSQLGGDTDTISQLRSGGIDMLTLSGLILSILVPAASINGIGFAFPDYATVWKAMDGKLGEYVRGQIAKSGLIAMDRMWDNGFRQMTTSTKPIQTQTDMDGFQDTGPGKPALDFYVQGPRRGSDRDQLRRGLFRAADPHRRRAGTAAGRDRHVEDV